MNKQYLGDSVYVENDGPAIVLTTENGEGASDTIVLEPEVYHALVCYVEKLNSEVKILGEGE